MKHKVGTLIVANARMIMDTHLSNKNEGLEFVSLTEITPTQLLGHYSRSRVVVEMAKGFSILVSADQFSNKDLRWVGAQIGEA
jgi:hypothetical protein